LFIVKTYLRLPACDRANCVEKITFGVEKTRQTGSAEKARLKMHGRNTFVSFARKLSLDEL